MCVGRSCLTITTKLGLPPFRPFAPPSCILQFKAIDEQKSAALESIIAPATLQTRPPLRIVPQTSHSAAVDSQRLLNTMSTNTISSLDHLPPELQTMILNQVILSTLSHDESTKSYKHIISQATRLALVQRSWAYQVMTLLRLSVAPWFRGVDMSLEAYRQEVRVKRKGRRSLASVRAAVKIGAFSALKSKLIGFHKSLTRLFRGMSLRGVIREGKLHGGKKFNSLVVECGTFLLQVAATQLTNPY